MATRVPPAQPPVRSPSAAASSPPSASGTPEPLRAVIWRGIVAFLKPLASLKITVVLFLMSIFIVFAGTLAQTEKDIWQVVHDYFRMDFHSLRSAMSSTMAWIDLRIFFPRSFFPNMTPIPWGVGFWFPKGWLIGFGLFINLLAAAHYPFPDSGQAWPAYGRTDHIGNRYCTDDCRHPGRIEPNGSTA